MLVAAFMPYITFVIAYSIKFFSRCFDKCNLPEGYKTNRVTIQQYITLYSGPDVVIHFRYANIMNQIFVSFTHGLAIPLLFPIALLGIINMYVVERLQFAYFYKQPPLMDNSLNDRALKILHYAPVAMMLFGYWQFGNRQMFFNEVTKIEHASEEPVTNHRILYFNFKDMQHTLLFLIFLPVFIFKLRFNNLVSRILTCLRLLEKPAAMDLECNLAVDVNENLGNYWKCLSGIDQKRWFTKELYLREVLKIKTLDDYNMSLISLG